jgi:hypothetical protein
MARPFRISGMWRSKTTDPAMSSAQRAACTVWQMLLMTAQELRDNAVVSLQSLMGHQD